MISTTSDPQLAETFVARRGSTGSEFRNQNVEDAQTHPCDLHYGFAGKVEDGVLFTAEEMEDKWDIYLYRPYVYMVRSWRGQLLYRAFVTADEKGLHVSRFDCASTDDPEFVRRVVDYLIRSHVFGLRLPHPIPADLPAEPQVLAAYSFSMFGRRCFYGSYADTTLVRAVEA
jgi:hypothetical protein